MSLKELINIEELNKGFREKSPKSKDSYHKRYGRLGN